jgi:hypothetical protein
MAHQLDFQLIKSLVKSLLRNRKERPQLGRGLFDVALIANSGLEEFAGLNDLHDGLAAAATEPGSCRLHTTPSNMPWSVLRGSAGGGSFESAMMTG